MAHPIRIGTSGWNYADWRGALYPAGMPSRVWLEQYARVFDTVEINNSFYRQPENRTFDRWREQTPEGFVFAVKANRYLTHWKKLKDPQEPLEHFLDGARRLGSRLGPILYQLPPHWPKDLERLGAFLQILPADLVHVVEFRDPDWLADDTYRLLEGHRVCLCIHDMLPRHPRRLTGPAAYVRLHGAGRKYGGRYTPARLRPWAKWIAEAAGERPVYAYFNNDLDGNAIGDALDLRKLVLGR